MYLGVHRLSRVSGTVRCTWEYTDKVEFLVQYRVCLGVQESSRAPGTVQGIPGRTQVKGRVPGTVQGVPGSTQIKESFRYSSVHLGVHR